MSILRCREIVEVVVNEETGVATLTGSELFQLALSNIVARAEKEGARKATAKTAPAGVPPARRELTLSQALLIRIQASSGLRARQLLQYSYDAGHLKPPARKGDYSNDRAIDRALQSLKRAGFIEFLKGAGWVGTPAGAVEAAALQRRS